MSVSPPGGPGTGEQDAIAIHVDHAQGMQVGDHNRQNNLTQVTAGRGALVAGGDVHVRELHVHGGDVGGGIPCVVNAPAGTLPQRQPTLPESYGLHQLGSALDRLFPGQEFSARWTDVVLAELRDEVDGAPPSEFTIRASRILDSLEIAQRTTTFLRSFMAGRLTGECLTRALSSLASTGLLSLRDAGGLSTEADYVEFVALNYPHAEHSCGPQLARFVLRLTSEAELDAGDPRLQEWAAGISALAVLNTEVAARHAWDADRRVRLIVSLHYGLAGDWPEVLGAWILLDGHHYAHKDFRCPTADQQGTEAALARAVDWAEESAEGLKLNLRRIEVAAPARILVRWRPEEVLYEQRLGVNFDVLARWSERLDQRPTARRLNRMARKRLADIARYGPGERMHWLAVRGPEDVARLAREFKDGVYHRAIGLEMHPGQDADMLAVVLAFTPILLWPQADTLGADHQAMIDAHWGALPTEFLGAYRDRWRGADGDGTGRSLMADVRFIWDDEDWLNFCRDLAVLWG